MGEEQYPAFEEKIQKMVIPDRLKDPEFFKKLNSKKETPPLREISD